MRRVFEQFGPLVSVNLVRNVVSGRSRGYGFVEFQNEREMRVALREGDGIKVDGRRILVDVERGRTIPDWQPRRLGGGLSGNQGQRRPKDQPPSRRPSSRERMAPRRKRSRSRSREKYRDDRRRRY